MLNLLIECSNLEYSRESKIDIPYIISIHGNYLYNHMKFI